MASVCDWSRNDRARRQAAHVLRKVSCEICGGTFETFDRGEIQRAKYCPGPCRAEAARRRKRAYRQDPAARAAHNASRRDYYRRNREEELAQQSRYKAEKRRNRSVA